METYRFYLDFYLQDFTRTRLVVKRRASLVVVWVAIFSALTSVVGAVTTLTGVSWLGIVTVALAGSVTTITVWDSHFRHRELWAQTSSILNELQIMQRDHSMALALGANADEIALTGMKKLSALLSRDLTSWLELRKHSEQSDTKSGTVEPRPIAD